ncbi:YeaC family protein [Symbiopectobacterium sp. RP]|uniref:YeaC family protein n=1 Tax=Symbiopectobacterium sp. RP TaxID=3248553 RepID=UPI003D27628F
MLDKQLDEVVTALTPDIYQRLATAVELGKWPDGVPLTLEQKENCLQMVMLWQSRHNVDAEHMTINTDGELVMKSKQELKQAFAIDKLIQRERQ